MLWCQEKREQAIQDYKHNKEYKMVITFPGPYWGSHGKWTGRGEPESDWEVTMLELPPGGMKVGKGGRV